MAYYDGRKSFSFIDKSKSHRTRLNMMKFLVRMMVGMWVPYKQMLGRRRKFNHGLERISIVMRWLLARNLVFAITFGLEIKVCWQSKSSKNYWNVLIGLLSFKLKGWRWFYRLQKIIRSFLVIKWNSHFLKLAQTSWKV